MYSDTPNFDDNIYYLGCYDFEKFHLYNFSRSKVFGHQLKDLPVYRPTVIGADLVRGTVRPTVTGDVIAFIGADLGGTSGAHIAYRPPTWICGSGAKYMYCTT